MSTSAGTSPSGPAEEARRLVEALGEWATARLGGVEAPIATGSAQCQLCPVCQLISVLRGDQGGELLARLGDAWAAFLGVLTEHRHPPSGSEPAKTDSPDADEVAEPPPARSVQTIEVR